MTPEHNLIDSVQEQVRRLSHAVLDLLFPPRCVACHRPGAHLCADCLAALPTLSGPLCPVCALPVEAPGICPRCAARRPSFTRVRSGYVYEGAVRRAVLAFKYNGRRALAAPLVDALSAVLPPPSPLPDALCAVPMHHLREQERGYNHAKLLADELGRCWGVRVLPGEALRRTQPTTRQVGLSYQARQSNVKGAFEAERRFVEGKVLVVVDDVCTTGATLDACAMALLRAGAAAVEGVTLARAL